MGCQPCNYHHEGNQRIPTTRVDFRGAITSKVDVFSCGKLLFEIISGKRNIEELNSNMRNYLPLQVANPIAKGGEVLPLVDCRLNGLVAMEEVCRACKVACWCIQDSERDRPTMSQVVQILEGICRNQNDLVPIVGYATLCYSNLIIECAAYKICENIRLKINSVSWYNDILKLINTSIHA